MKRCLLGLFWSLLACGSQPEVHSGGPSDAGPRTDASRGGAPQAGEDDRTPPNTSICKGAPVELQPSGVKVVVAVDGSASMGPSWAPIRDAVRGLMEVNPSLQIGADVFWGLEAESIEESLERINTCGDTAHNILPLGQEQSSQVERLFGSEPPGQGAAFWDFTPVADPLNYYLTNDTPLSDPSTTNYLVLLSDGRDNCYGNFWAGEADKVNAYQKLARELGKKHIRVLPVGFNGANVGPTTGAAAETDFTALDAIATQGGTGLQKALVAADSGQLAQAFAAVSQQIGSCRFQIPTVRTGEVDPFGLRFEVDGIAVSRDRTAKNGWNFVGGQTNEVEFYGEACKALRAGAAPVATQVCAAERVCGTATSRVSAKPRAVQYLLTRSSSMATCSEGALDCIPGLGTALTWWGVAARAISSSVTAPINDDVEYGLKYFPDRGASDCTVSSGPVIECAPGTALDLLGDMLHTLPGGASPLISALEDVAANPGRLADAEVAGSLIVVSDGGESCVGRDQAERVACIAAATRALHAKGVRVFAVRFGSKGDDFADQDAQLRAIAREGGTATGDPNDPNNTPYLEAPDAETLNTSLAAIAQELASCTLSLGALDPHADETNVNLYLEGDVVPFDAVGTKQSGWGWKDSDELELYGPTCAAYKESRATSIMIEVGCRPVIVI